MPEGILEPQPHLLFRKETMSQPTGCLNMIIAPVRGSFHGPQQSRPVQGSRAPELKGPGIRQSPLLGSQNNEATVIQAPSSRPAEHLQELVRSKKKKTVVHPVFPIRDQDRSHGKINPRAKSGGRHHHL